MCAESLAKSRAADLRYRARNGHGRDPASVQPVSAPALRGSSPSPRSTASSSSRSSSSITWQSAYPVRFGLTLVYVGDRVAAFNWHLIHGEVYYLLFAGLDYDLNPSLDLYFDLMYAEMDPAFARRGEGLVFGQTADDFKVRLGCRPESGDTFMSRRWASPGPSS